ncbi:ABC transporter permease [Taklimakanibacter deserti]|uniref:ABC transporter permease n=1 Tax=Taklimakanibacter deserti TaxID=2267839 RepID=UPI000E64CBF6
MTAAVFSSVLLVRPRWTLVAGATLMALLIVMACVPWVFAPYDPIAFDYGAIMQPPSAAHPFGTDNFGRDVLSRVIWATRVDMQIAIFSTIFPLVFGTFVGTLTGYYGGWLDTIFGRLVDVAITFPFLVIVIAIVSVLGPGLFNMYIAVSAVGWVFYAQLARAEIMVQKHSDYAAAARVLGYTEPRLIFRHLLPNAVTPIIVYWMTDMALDILLGSSLGYLGLGAQPPTAEWGVIIADGKNFMSTAWWISVFPGIAIVIAGLAFSLLGDGLADLFRRQR